MENAPEEYTTDFSDNPREYREMMQLYGAAVRAVQMKLEVLSDDFRLRYEYEPIHQIHTRLKTPVSIANKLRRKGLSVTIESAEENLNDIAGVRIVCNYIEDIYRVEEMLLRQNDVTPVERKDYIESPKPSGYRSLHLVVRVPVFLTNHTEEVAVEIQMRTIAMDFWASLEHELRYKSDLPVDSALRDRLKRCAEAGAALDIEMQSIYHEIGKNKISEGYCAERDFRA